MESICPSLSILESYNLMVKFLLTFDVPTWRSCANNGQALSEVNEVQFPLFLSFITYLSSIFKPATLANSSMG